MTETDRAAERLRRWRNGEEVRAAYSKSDSWPAVLRDIDTLIAEHAADDDQPINAKTRIRYKVSESVLVEVCGDNVIIRDDCDYAVIELPIKKVGQLRQLLRALGVSGE